MDQLKDLLEQANNLNEKEDTIKQQERNQKLLEQQYTYFMQNLAQARIDRALRKKRIRALALCRLHPLVSRRGKSPKDESYDPGGKHRVCVCLAFVTEFFLDPTLKRPLDIQNKLGLPLMLSIPKLSLNGKSHHLNGSKTAGLLEQGSTNGRGSDEKKPDLPALRTEIPLWDAHHLLKPFVEALRDSLDHVF
jgi:hypothetical protein